MLQLESNGYIQSLAYQIQKEGNVCNGDSFFIKATEDYFICLVADGLGSGLNAHASSNAIREVVKQYHHEEVEVLIDICNKELKNKRGATVSILKVNFLHKKFTYSSVGNIRFILYSPSDQFIYPLPVFGFLSGKPQKYRIDTFSYEKGSKFIIHTDGIYIPAVKQLLRSVRTIEDMSNYLKMYTKTRNDDLTYIIGQLF
ncbi:SpoIIE family protein phosphatase [Bacillus sp. FJAT-29790]|uniref:PP2C family serine/threonine-protein phosphatase n=1 Tax=Bacillus sp. FJAT-29790 TaxID=1895002 RepID=UPI001C24EBC6|nr:PP2C family serine/threonine-protein phosphatase [Bacillus sp. FJAT-29790]MBU8880534.1 SpoIIE family protein phosphatase [Bacillus sp. FJAT-29790]